MKSKDLQQRLKNFALRLVPLCGALPKKKVSRIIEDQLLRSGFSAANYRSACNAQSKKSFNARLSTALEEMDEAAYWLEMVGELGLIKPEKLSLILKEALELTRILGAFRRTVTRNLKIDN